jgi:hypothetical protein
MHPARVQYMFITIFFSGSITSTDGQYFWELNSEEIDAQVRGYCFLPRCFVRLKLTFIGRSLSLKVTRLHPRGGSLNLLVEEWLVRYELEC